MSKYMFFTILFLISAPTWARKPAVEPILGVSIEEYKEVPPEQAKGYDFSETKNLNTQERVHSPEGIEVKSLSDSSSSSTSKLLFLFFMFLPIIASGFAFFKVTRKDHSNVISLEELRTRKSKEEESNDDIPKAS